MIYEIINPSDPVTLSTDDEEAACAAALLLGEGRYGLLSEAGEYVLPILAFGNGADAWSGKRWCKPLGEWLDGLDKQRLSAVLATALVGKPSERRAIEARGADPRKWNESRRSSMNDICGRAFDLAEHFRAAAPTRPTPEAP